MELVFSYGILADRFKQKSVNATLTANLKMDKYGMFNALKPSVEKNSFDGYLLRLTKEEFLLADIVEGYPEIYNRKKFKIKLEENTLVEAWVYFIEE